MFVRASLIMLALVVASYATAAGPVDSVALLVDPVAVPADPVVLSVDPVAPTCSAVVVNKSICPEPAKCYVQSTMMPCNPHTLCAQMPRPMVVCAWTCGAKAPQGCKKRCRQNSDKVCNCEIVCEMDGPCKAEGVAPE